MFRHHLLGVQAQASCCFLSGKHMCTGVEFFLNSSLHGFIRTFLQETGELCNASMATTSPRAVEAQPWQVLRGQWFPAF